MYLPPGTAAIAGDIDEESSNGQIIVVPISLDPAHDNQDVSKDRRLLDALPIDIRDFFRLQDTEYDNDWANLLHSCSKNRTHASTQATMSPHHDSPTLMSSRSAKRRKRQLTQFRTNLRQELAR